MGAWQDHQHTIKSHSSAVQKEHKLAEKLSTIQHSHTTALNHEQQLAQVGETS